MCRYNLANYASTIADIKHDLNERLNLWQEYETNYDRINVWLDDAVTIIKTFNLKNSFQEKVEQLDSYQVSKSFSFLNCHLELFTRL